MPVFVLGGGSNVLISDEGFKGLVIHINIGGIIFNKDLVYAGAGVNWDNFVGQCVNNNFYGLEALSGIPGTVGGAVVQNAGAYGGETKDTLYKVEIYDTQKDDFLEVDNAYCQFGYRSSIFKGSLEKIVVGAFFAKRDKVFSENKEVIERLKLKGENINSINIRNAVLELRKEKSTIYDLSDPNSISAGCFFKNPVVGKDFFDNLLQLYPDIPYWLVNGQVKLSAGWLVEKSGFPKGFVYKEGKVGLSEKHALVIVNKGNATALDIVEFVKMIQQKTYEKFKIYLETEVLLVGFI